MSVKNISLNLNCSCGRCCTKPEPPLKNSFNHFSSTNCTVSRFLFLLKKYQIWSKSYGGAKYNSFILWKHILRNKVCKRRQTLLAFSLEMHFLWREYRSLSVVIEYASTKAVEFFSVIFHDVVEGFPSTLNLNDEYVLQTPH